jgi:hypothetical protein
MIVIPCSLVPVYQHFRHEHTAMEIIYTLKMEVLCSTEIYSVILQNKIMNLRYENLEPYCHAFE